MILVFFFSLWWCRPQFFFFLNSPQFLLEEVFRREEKASLVTYMTRVLGKIHTRTNHRAVSHASSSAHKAIGRLECPKTLLPAIFLETAN